MNLEKQEGIVRVNACKRHDFLFIVSTSGYQVILQFFPVLGSQQTKRIFAGFDLKRVCVLVCTCIVHSHVLGIQNIYH